jgi:SSS family solute:Na+ symporter
MSLNWWTSWYPGAEPGGGGYVAQRIFFAKNEKPSLGATLWFNTAHYALRPWPWIATALVAMVLLPSPTQAQGGMEGAYVCVMVHYLPPSLRGLILAGFAEAYLSTTRTHLNPGASYMVNDIYGRFLAPGKSEKDYVAGSRLATILVALLSAGSTYYMQTHGGLDRMLVIAPLNSDDPHALAWLMLITTLGTPLLRLGVTLATRPETEETLRKFYALVRPAVFGWSRFASEQELQEPTLRYNFYHWVLGFTLVYSILFGVGNVLFGWVWDGHWDDCAEPDVLGGPLAQPGAEGLEYFPVRRWRMYC